MKTQETNWAIDPSHSKVAFKVKHLMISNVLGNFKEFEGQVNSDENDFSGAVINLPAFRFANRWIFLSIFS